MVVADGHNHTPRKRCVHSDAMYDFTVRCTCLPRGPGLGEQNDTGNMLAGWLLGSFTGNLRSKMMTLSREMMSSTGSAQGCLGPGRL